MTTDVELIKTLAEPRVLFPDWRMGQLVANLALAAGATLLQGCGKQKANNCSSRRGD